jgi:hypothetical protein
MNISYKKRKINFNLIFGLAWLLIFFITVFTKDKLNWVDYGYLVLSAMFFIGFLYQRQNICLTIENGFIKEKSLFGKKLNLKDIKQIKTFAGDYILKSEKTEFTINTDLIDPGSMMDLKKELKSLNVEWT